MTSAQRFVRHAVLVAPLVLVNTAAVYGQVQWAAENLTRDGIGQAVLFAVTVESIALFLAYEAHTALLAGDASLRLRVASYLAAGLVGILNYSHFAAASRAPQERCDVAEAELELTAHNTRHDGCATLSRLERHLESLPAGR